LVMSASWIAAASSAAWMASSWAKHGPTGGRFSR
jgi:hypothetical protein